ncbi:Lrp/AsnC family transcriptional regulator [Pseudomonas luteola]|uniref:Lrp/AsnC family transcriptional regulator n=1 Tax=Pseudomonas luteola TaxID=47886 RepID=UPI000F779665|nr:Lrp/AsnC family transcriptional regulator [Pseudomonas luteola]RRW39554.1 Lrp/AsnC family transcriptional regulator [Pseudomonas luteola]
MKSKSPELDRLDWRILEALQRNARITSTELGKRIGLSQPAVTSRIKRLEETDVIDGYGARLNHKLLGRPIRALLRLRTSHAQIPACLEAFETIPQIIEAMRVTGEDCFVVRVVAGEMEQLEAVIDALAKLGPVTTSIILASYPQKVLQESTQ